MFEPARRGTRAALGGLILGAVMAALALSACGLFDIRDPVAPTGENLCLKPPANSDDNVLVNFTLAMNCGKGGLSLMDQTLGPDFVFELDPLDAADFNGRDSLTRAEDYQAHQTIVNNVADSLYFEFTPVQPIREGTSSLYEDMPYLLELLIQQADTLEVAGTYSGTVDLTVVESGAGEWVMRRWKDQGDESLNNTLGALYATYAIEQSRSAGTRDVVD